MKKLFLLLCALVLAVALAAAEAPVPTAEPPVPPLLAAAQDTVTAVLRLNAPSMGGMQAQLQWDPLVLELAAEPAFDPAFQQQAMIAMLHPDAALGTLNMVYLRQDDAAFENTIVLTLSFRVKDDAFAGETVIQLNNLLLTNTAAEPLPCETADACVTIMSDVPTPTPTLTPEPTPEAVSPTPTCTPEPTPETTEDLERTAKLSIELQVIPFATPTPQPTATPKPTFTPRPAVTSTPVPTATPPSSHTGGSISSGSSTTPTRKPTPTPSPTPITLGGNTPVPQHQANLYLRTRQTTNGFAVDLLADGVTIGGLQAVISYSADTAVYEKGAFHDAFAQKGMMNLINDSVPGQIKLVYSSLDGFEAKNSVLFTAEFSADLTENIALALANVKLTDASAQLNTWIYADQQYTVQPMDDLTESDALPAAVMHLLAGESFTLMFNAGETVELLAENAVWTSSRPEIVSVTEDGLAAAIQSGAAVLTAQDASTGQKLLEGTLCVRDQLTGLPLDVRNVQVYHAEQAAFGLQECPEDDETLLQHGLRLTFHPTEKTTVIIDGVLPTELVTLPAHAFLGCGSLTDIDVIGTQITAIDDMAFDGCPALQSIRLHASLTGLAPDALHCSSPVTLKVPAGSDAESFILQHPELTAAMEVVYE